MTDPKAIHIADQGIAAHRTYATAIAAFYDELIEGGVKPEHALVITVEHMRTAAKQQ